MNSEWSMSSEERKKFWDTLCSLDGQDVENEIKRLLATIKFPRFLYRYRSVNNKSLSALIENKLYFSTSDYYDDPFDTYIRIDRNLVLEGIKQEVEDLRSNENRLSGFSDYLGISKEECEKFLTDKTAEFIGNTSYDFFKRIRRELRKEIYSVCFSDTWKNENLWLKYADQHKGFAVVYDRSDDSSWLCGTETECFNCMNKDLNAYIYPMCYSDEKYDATIYARDYAVHRLLLNLNNSYTNPLLQFVPDHPWEKEKITLIKKKCHEYDAEWRAILSTPYYLNAPVYKKWKPYGVILGLNMEADSRKIVINAAETAGITGVFQVGISDDDELDLMPISDRKG